MTEQEVREAIAKIDELRKRAATLENIAEWPMGLPSEMRADKRRGWFTSIWRGHGETTHGEVTLTRDERRELREWMNARARGLRAEADRTAAVIEKGNT